jgi:cysteine-rich repeat protein
MRLRSVFVALGWFSLGAVACNQIAGIEAGKPLECVTVEQCESEATSCHVPVACTQGECVFKDTKNGAVSCDTGRQGACAPGTQQCDANGQPAGICEGAAPIPEQCDADRVDEDCDGQVNESGTMCVCGDGYVSTQEEECDDGGTVDGDHCSATCLSERVLQISAGEYLTCALLNGGSVKCWGSNAYGQLGQGHTSQRGSHENQMGNNLPFIDLGAGQVAIALSAGVGRTCAILQGGAVKCFGLNAIGQLGLGNTDLRGDGPGEMGDALPAVDLGSGSIALAVAMGKEHTCTLLNDGDVKCWGKNKSGALGLGTSSDFNIGDVAGEMGAKLSPIDLAYQVDAVGVDAGTYQTCAILNPPAGAGAVKCWGSNSYGQLGLKSFGGARGDAPDEMGSFLPFVDLGEAATALATGYNHTCALLKSGDVKCWGANEVGELGLGDKMPRTTPQRVDLGTDKAATAIAAGNRYTCALLSEGSVKCWGKPFFGALGYGNADALGDEPDEMGDNLPAIDLGSGKKATAITAGGTHSCALLDDESIKCWGFNTAGELGLGDMQTRGDDPGEMGDNLPTVKLYSDTW